MKNHWTEEVVNRNSDRAGFSNPHEYLLAKQREFEARTGVSWSVSHQHGGYTFDPVDDDVPAVSNVDSQALKAVRDAYNHVGKGLGGYATYLDVYEVSGIGLRNLMGVVKFMERVGLALRVVNRMGKAHAFKLR